MSPSAALTTHSGRFSIVQAELPPQGLTSLGVLLEDPQTNTLRLRFRRDLDALLEDGDDLDVLEGLADDLAAKAAESGAEKLFEYLEKTLSGTYRITDRQQVLVSDFDRTLDRLYRQHVQSKVQEYRTHLPRYSLRVAAGKFLENEEVTETDWIEVPSDLRLTPGMFIAQIAGQSMEPLIPDGSLCIFRHGVTGSRQGRLVLAEHDNQYAVKRYQSMKASSEQGWRHERIRLESLNPEYPSWDLDPDEEKYRIIAEFVRVLD